MNSTPSDADVIEIAHSIIDWHHLFFAADNPDTREVVRAIVAAARPLILAGAEREFGRLAESHVRFAGVVGKSERVAVARHQRDLRKERAAAWAEGYQAGTDDEFEAREGRERESAINPYRGDAS